jgi:hypothetical protein
MADSAERNGEKLEDLEEVEECSTGERLHAGHLPINVGPIEAANCS